jgi:hypothetical protein
MRIRISPNPGADIAGGPQNDIHAAASEAKPRVDLLDEMGIYAVERSEEKLKDLPPDVLRKIMQDNAAKLYKIDV